MSKVLFNATNEEFRHFYSGKEFVIAKYPEDGHQVMVDDPVANFLITKLAQRGLMELVFGDEGEKKERKRVEGVRKNTEFKRRQVINFNRLNEERTHRRLPYEHPTAQIKEYAKEMAMELIEPYDTKDLERAEAAEIKKERDELMLLLKKQGDQIAELMKMARNGKPEEMEGSISKDDFIKIQKELGYKMMNKADFVEWVKANSATISTQPVEIQADIQKKWESFYDEKYPVGG